MEKNEEEVGKKEEGKEEKCLEKRKY